MKTALGHMLLCAGLLGAGGASADIGTATAIFEPMMRTLTVTCGDDLMTDPVLRLGSADKVTFSFDEIADDRRYLRCRLMHCNADWQPSRLLESEYVDGFNFAEIDDFAFSQNTFVHYVNYRFTLGPDNLGPLVSGNYLWQVYDESDPDKVLLQARFRVTEDVYRVAGKADGRTDRGFNTDCQQLSLQLSPVARLDANPYTDLLVTVTQNGRPDTAHVIGHPQRMEGDRVIYEHMPGLIFPAGNEYRRFETVRTTYPGMGVDSTGYVEPMYHAWLAEAEPRNGRGYLYDSTQRGRYKIDEYNSTDPDLGADYVMTHFTLDFPEVTDGDIFVEGDLALRGYTAANRMTYDPAGHLYHLAMPLKQGSYNYQYVVRRRGGIDPDISLGGNFSDTGSDAADASVVEGDHFETINEYNVYVYLRQPGARADRLVGSATILATP